MATVHALVMQTGCLFRPPCALYYLIWSAELLSSPSGSELGHEHCRCVLMTYCMRSDEVDAFPPTTVVLASILFFMNFVDDFFTQTDNHDKALVSDSVM